MPVKKEEGVQVQFTGLNSEEIDSLHAFLKSQKSVTYVHSRVRNIDAGYDPTTHERVLIILGFSIGIARVLGQKVLDIASGWIREWLAKQATESANVEIALIYGADEKVVRRVKKPRPPKAK